MSELRRREALGRNRKGPAVNSTVTWLVIGCAVLIGGAGFAFFYFTKPERVFGAKALNCAAHQIEWTTADDLTIIGGCGRTVKAVCSDRGCEKARFAKEHMHEF